MEDYSDVMENKIMKYIVKWKRQLKIIFYEVTQVFKDHCLGFLSSDVLSVNYQMCVHNLEYLQNAKIKKGP